MEGLLNKETQRSGDELGMMQVWAIMGLLARLLAESVYEAGNLVFVQGNGGAEGSEG